jgi:hypothetical protein
MSFDRFAILACGLIVSVHAHAAAQRTFVSTGGVDNPTCSLIAPCRTFAGAIAATSAGGEVVVVDSGGYGPVTISQSVTIVAPAGVHAAVSIPGGGQGITTSPGVYDVTLRGLTLIGTGGSAYGIRAQHDGSLTVERVSIEGAATGIAVTPPVGATLVLRDVALRKGTDGISATRVTGTFTRVSADNFAGWSIYVSSGSTVAISQATVSNATGNGYGAIAGSASGGGVTRLSVTESTISNVSFGIASADFGGTVLVEATGNAIIAASSAGLSAQGANATLVASRNSVTRSNVGLQAGSGGTLITFNDNSVVRNTLETSGAMTSAGYR